jgi:hypothetical protein
MGTALSCAEGSTCPPVGTTRESGFRCTPPVFGRPLARPAVGPSPDVAELRHAHACLSTTFFGCCPYVVTVLLLCPPKQPLRGEGLAAQREGPERGGGLVRVIRLRNEWLVRRRCHREG